MKYVFLLLTCILLSTSAFSQVGIGTVNPDASAALDLTSTAKGLLPPRLTTLQRNGIASPAQGLTIFNTDVNCLQWYNGSGWYNACDGKIDLLGGGFTNGFQGNNLCTTKVISVTSCASVAGATINDDATTEDGIEYDWPGATSYMGGDAIRALVEIGGQCWFRRNTTATPTPPYTGTNDWNGYYNNELSELVVGEGRLYQWESAMNGSTAERAQGVCPAGWHVPSDCELMFLEGTLGMSTADQELNLWRNSGSVGSKLKSGGSSGFTALLAGERGTNGTFRFRSSHGLWWSSSEAVEPFATSHYVHASAVGVNRSNSYDKSSALSVRCIKD